MFQVLSEESVKDFSPSYLDIVKVDGLFHLNPPKDLTSESNYRWFSCTGEEEGEHVDRFKGVPSVASQIEVNSATETLCLAPCQDL